MPSARQAEGLAPSGPLPRDANPAPRTFLGRFFSFPMLLATGLAAVIVCTVSNRFYDPDLWWHLRVGQIIWNSHSIPATDTFSFTAQNHPWTAHEWLSQLSIFASYVAGGYRGLMGWLAVLASLTFLLVYCLCWRASHNALLAFMGGLLAWFFGTADLAVRPLILGHLFLAAELLLLDLAGRNRRFLWLLPPLFALWANCHGSYFFGMAVLGIYWLVIVLRRDPEYKAGSAKAFTILLLACAAAICCNPVGTRLLIYPLDTLFHQSTGLSAVQEWLPPALLDGRTLCMLGALVAIALIAVRRGGGVTLREALLMGMALALAVQHRRMFFLFGIIVAPVLCRALSPYFGPERRRDLPVANAVLMMLCVVAMVAAFPSRPDLETQVRQKSPQAAIDYIRRAGLHGPVLNEYGFGGYMIWAWREEKVFVDGRADVFDWTGVLSQYLRWIMLDDDPRILLDKYGIRLCLLPPEASITRVMPYLPGWRQVYADKVAVVFAR